MNHSGLVSLTVGETGRSRPRGPRVAVPVYQWSCRWAPDGPGPVSEGCPGEPDLALALAPDDATLVLQGELPPSVAFMQGRLKTAGDNGLLLTILEWTATTDLQAAMSRWAKELGLAQG